MTKRFTKTIATMIVAAFIFTGCTAKNTAPVTTETIDVTTYTVIDDKEPTITETSKNEDGTTVVITKTTDGTIVSKATVKETETTTTETTVKTTETTPKATETKATEVTETTPKATETTPKDTEPTTPEPTETVKPTEPTKEPTKETTKTPTKEPTKPTETTKPTTKQTEPTTKPTTPEPTEPKPTETTPAPTTPAPKKYEVFVQAQTGGTATGAGLYKVGEKVTIKATANAGYHFTGWDLDGNGNTNATYTFTMPDYEVIFVACFEKDAEVAPTKPMTYYATADFYVRVGYYDTENVHHEVVLTKSGITVYTTDGRLTSTHANLYEYDNTRTLVKQLLTEYDSSAIMEGYGQPWLENIRDERENP